MPDQTAKTIRLADYQPNSHLVKAVDLTFNLHPTKTRVIAEIVFAQNPEAGNEPKDLWLDGRNLNLISAQINGVDVSTKDLQTSEDGLLLNAGILPSEPFRWRCEVEIDPTANTELEGLYMSGGMYCTQCEAEGFRKITYYPDRPDVMSTFTVTINGDAPVLLSNGNLIERGKNTAKWHDPWPKPAYLFALVAGDLVSLDDRFTTVSGRDVKLQIFVRDGDLDKCDYAMDALKRSMKWDEEVYGREYDLDLFMIVAVDDFNMGAMENKGLNIFNSALVLASPETATDDNYARIESVIAHEYFHNWTGNRITCRDWFQLCLKEGLTVFRDQQFSADMRDASVTRIADVLALRGRQFREDAGPLAHPVRPEEYIEINNFYTATVYEKGAELIGMLRGLVGPKAYRDALDLYFDRHDGQACTIENWLQVFEDATGRDLSQFKLWYSQAGTPVVTVAERFDGDTLILEFTQKNPATPNQEDKQPQVIPIAVGLLANDGSEVRPTEVLELTKASQSFSFSGLKEQPVPSLLRGFSAPIILQRATSGAEQAFLLANDTDPFNKWEAARRLVSNNLRSMALADDVPDEGVLEALKSVALDSTLDPAFRALVLGLPSEDELAQQIFDRGETPDPDAIHIARRFFTTALATVFDKDAMGLFVDMAVPGPYSPDATAAGKRALQGAMLRLITRLDQGEVAIKIFDFADNMTVQLSSLSSLLANDVGDAASATFYARWRRNKLVLDKWFMLSASHAPREKAVQVAQELADHPDFDWKNPNRFRALIAGFAMGNPAGFHSKDGAGYDFFADWLIRLDPLNPQTTARMAGVFESWKRYDPKRQTLIKSALSRINETPDLSKNTREIVERILQA